MKPPSRDAWAALGRLVIVLAIVAGAWIWWEHQHKPDLVTDVRLPLVPENAARLQALHSVPLNAGVRSGWRIDLRRPALFAFTVPGERPVLRFHEAYLEGRPRLAITVVRADGERELIWEDAATENTWTVRRVPLPVDVGETVDVEFECLDGGARRQLGAVYIADVVLESEGRRVDGTDVPVKARAVERDLLSDHMAERRLAPPNAIATSLSQSGPGCVELLRDRPLQIDIDVVPKGARAEIAIHAASTGATPRPAMVRIIDPSVGELMALDLDGLGEPGGVHNEISVSLDIAEQAGGSMSLQFVREGGDNLFVGLRDVALTTERLQPRTRFDPEFGSNVLLVVVDGLRPDRLGVYGDDYAVTPNIDALAERGIRYTDMHAPSSWSLPSVASLFTGLSPLSHGIGVVRGIRLSERAVTLAQSAQWAGMSTALFGSSPSAGRVHGLDRGYEVHSAAASLPASTIVDRAIDWLENQRDFEWFLTLQFDDPEAPHQIVLEDGHEMPNELDPELVERMRRVDSRPSGAEALVGEVGTLYANEVARVDFALGRLFDHMRARGTLDRTLVVFVGSCGQEFYEHGGRGNGRSLFDEVTRVPAIVAGPGVRAGSIVVDTPSELVDITQLVGYLANLRAGNAFQGRLPEPFASLPGSQPVVSSVLVPSLGSTVPWLGKARYDGYSYYRDVRTGRELLFDLSADPGELRDLVPEAEDGELRLRLDMLRQAQQRWGRTCWGASWPWATPRDG